MCWNLQGQELRNLKPEVPIVLNIERERVCAKNVRNKSERWRASTNHEVVGTCGRERIRVRCWRRRYLGLGNEKGMEGESRKRGGENRHG